MKDQSVIGADNVLAGRDNHIANYVIANFSIEQIEKEFSEINLKILNELGRVAIPNAVSVDFDCEHLFASLVKIGVPTSVSIVLACRIMPYIREAIESDTEVFSTAHIRRAVSLSILHMPELNLTRRERQQLAAKYARNYGNPRHIVMIVFDNGEAQPINYRYLKDSFIPNLLSRLTGQSFYEPKIISSNNYEHMANEIMDCARRLGVYHVRYSTMMALAEDLATQLPHPWVIHSRNRQGVILHDLERINDHLAVMGDAGSIETQFWRSAYEAFNHCCALILTIYECPIGGGTHAPSNTLRNITRLRADGEHQNLALWDFCSVRDLEDDLPQTGLDLNGFHDMIKSCQVNIDRMREDKVEYVRIQVTRLSEIAKKILDLNGGF